MRVPSLGHGDPLEEEMATHSSTGPSVSVARLCLTLCDPMDCSTSDSLSITNTRSLLKLMSIIIQWYHPTISSFVVPFSCLQSFPASGSFQLSHFFISGGQRIGFSASASVLPMNVQDWYPLDGLAGSPWSPRDSQESSPTPQFKSINSSALSFLYSPTLTSIHTTGKTIALTRRTFVGKVMSLLFNAV